MSAPRARLHRQLGEGYGRGYGRIQRYLDCPGITTALEERFVEETGPLGEHSLAFQDRVLAARTP